MQPLKNMKSFLRSLVALPKQSHYDPHTDQYFDLSYITPQLIVCSGPVSLVLESFYRHPISDLVSFLDRNHPWHIFNFREEGAGYTDEDVRGKVSHYPFPDHQPLTLGMMVRCVEEMEKFIEEDNVAVLHCQAGKGRSGMMACAYLIKKKNEDPSGFGGEVVINKENTLHTSSEPRISLVQSILDSYTSIRMKDYSGEGISIKSQKRYLHYWYIYLNSSSEEQSECLKRAHCELVGIRLIDCENEVTVCLQEYGLYRGGVQMRDIYTFEKQLREGQDMIMPSKIQISKDIRLSINGWCYTWLNTYFEEKREEATNIENDNSSSPKQLLKHHGSFKFSVDWNDLDGFKGTGYIGAKLFKRLEVYWK